MQHTDTASLISPSTQSDHAHLIQQLSAMMAQIALLQNVVREGEESAGEATSAFSTAQLSALRNGLAALEQMASDMLYEMRIAGEDSSSDALPDMPLGEALSQTVEESAETLHLSSRVSFTGEERPLSSEIERLLYRAAREVLARVSQHTGARRLRFALHYGRDEVSMSIEDDGVPVETGVPGIFSAERVAVSVPPFVQLRL
jgi:signal transduction histidine kinase